MRPHAIGRAAKAVAGRCSRVGHGRVRPGCKRRADTDAACNWRAGCDQCRDRAAHALGVAQPAQRTEAQAAGEGMDQGAHGEVVSLRGRNR